MVGTFWIFRFVILSNFDEIPGNIGDARFLLYFCEHWHKVFQGTAAWLSPPFFYPITGVLGYSDALFLYGLPFSLFRLLGIDNYTSFQILVVLLPPIGYFGTVWMLRSTFRLGRVAAIVGAMLFAFSSPMITSLAHAQLQAVVLVPYLVLLLCHYLRHLGDRKAIPSGLAFAVLFPLLAYTAFYIAWYFVIFCALVAIVAALWLIVTRQQKQLLAWLRIVAKSWLSVAANVVVCLLCGIPFIITYLPILRMFRGRPFLEVLPMLPRPVDLINVGFDNAVWGNALKAIVPGLQSRPLFWELDKGISPIVLVVFVSSGLFAWFQCRSSRHSTQSAEAVPFTAEIVVWCSLAVCLSWALMLRWGAFSPWALIYTFVPGGSAIRAVYRFNIFLMLPVAGVVAYGIDHVLRRTRFSDARVRKLLLSLVVIAMLIEQCNTFHRDILSKQSARAMIEQVPAPPAACKSMVLMADTAPYGSWTNPLQISAMLISQRFDLPTLNGTSGWTPKDWSLDNPMDPAYRKRVMSWASEHNISKGLCTYQIETKTWKLLSDTSGPGG